MSGRFLPPDHSRGDPNTLGGYMAVHGRPAAFEGSDGMSYSVAIEVDRVGGAEPFAAYLLFIRWRRLGPQGVEGHLESDYLARGRTAEEAGAALGRLKLSQVKELLDQLIAARAAPGRRWWNAAQED
jgi:hypothetical protein